MAFIVRLYFFKLAVLLLLLGCGRTYKPLPFESESLSQVLGSHIILPSNSSGTKETGEVTNDEKSTVIIPANKKYNPVEFNDGWYFVSEKSYFEIADRIEVVSGRPGNHLAILSISRNQSLDEFPKNLNCVFVGEGDNTFGEYLLEAKPYSFNFCVEGSIVINESNFLELKNGSENLIDDSNRLGTLLEFERGDKLEIHVQQGNHKQDASTLYVATEVRYIFSKTNH